jgi:serine/threonine protein kinase/Tol biopolymer transport system component
MPLAAGTRLAHYEILDSLGAGGMGEVYRARDTILSREVALKILPAAVAADPERRARFGREARTLAALNHPHIAQVHGFEDSGPTSALIMELVAGEDLSQRIRRGPIPFDEAIAIARQIGQALEAAHDQGIVHRDLKPGNIKLREDGTIKVLDFGLAKALEIGAAKAESSAQLANSPTITSPASLTAGGVILGTAAYMAPEQAKGKAVDKRVDIWAFGCVLYEMLTARKAFAGDDVSDTLASILKSDVDYSGVPPKSIRLIRKCLEKDPKRRLHDIADAWDLLDDHAPVAAQTTRQAWLPWALAALFLMSTAALLAMRLLQAPVAPSSVRFQVAPPPKTNFEIYVALSPDGKRIAFTAVNADHVTAIWVHDLELLEAHQLPGTEGAWSPFWSPDGKYLAFAVDRALKKIDVNGGQPQTIAEITGSQVGLGSWNRDGTIIFGTRGVGPIRRIPAAGGKIEDVTSIDPSRGETLHAFPAFLPDGRRFLYFRGSTKPEFQGVYLGSIDKPADQQDPRLVAPATLGPVQFSTGPSGDRLLVFRDGIVTAQPFDMSRGQVSGDALNLAEHIGNSGSFAFFSAAAGVVVYRTGVATSNFEAQLTWVDRRGTALGTVGGRLSVAREPAAVAISPDGKQAAVMIVATTLNNDLWTVEFARGIPTRVTFTQASETGGVWSPDGGRLAFRSGFGVTNFDIFSKDLNGTSDEAPMMTPPMRGVPTDWSADGRFLFFSRGVNAGGDLFAFDVKAKKPTAILESPFDELDPHLSPDGRVLAYVSNESGSDEVYLRPFTVAADGTPSLGPKWRVSNAGGVSPKWRRDGKELFFRSLAFDVMAVDVVTKEGSTQTALPHKLFSTPGVFAWDVAADGQRFLLSMPLAANTNADAPPDPFTVVLNWESSVKR